MMNLSLTEVGAGGFVRYSKVSFIGRFTIIMKLLYPKCKKWL